MQIRFYFAAIFSCLISSPLMAELTHEKSCLGTYEFSNAIDYDRLVELIIQLDENKRTVAVILDIHYVAIGYEGHVIRETESNIIATSSAEERMLINYNKLDSSILMVVNFENGYVNKFEGTCY